MFFFCVFWFRHVSEEEYISQSAGGGPCVCVCDVFERFNSN